MEKEQKGGVLFPPPLRKGDTVLLFAPSSPLSGEQSVEDIARAVEALGYRTRIGETCRGAAACGYAAAPAARKAEELNRAFADPTIHGIWCVRGGSTAWQMLPFLDYEAVRRHPKALIGFSDVTSLHLALQRRCGLVTWHGPTANRTLDWGEEDFSRRSLEAALGDWESLPVENPPDSRLTALRPGRAEGILVGGNLSLVAASIGTPWQVETEGKILFLEDVGEDVYALERMLAQLWYGGIFDRAAGVLLGAFTQCANRYREDYGPEALMADFFREYPKPVLLGLRSAHVSPMVTLPLGATCHMDAGTGRVEFFRTGEG